MNNYAMNKMRIYALRRLKIYKNHQKYTEKRQNKAEKRDFYIQNAVAYSMNIHLVQLKYFAQKYIKLM